MLDNIKITAPKVPDNTQYAIGTKCTNCGYTQFVFIKKGTRFSSEIHKCNNCECKTLINNNDY